MEGRRARLRARAGDLWLDALLSLRGTARRLEDGPPREVLVMSIYRPESERLSDAGRELESEHHRVRYAFGSTAADTLPGVECTTTVSARALRVTGTTRTAARRIGGSTGYYGNVCGLLPVRSTHSQVSLGVRPNPSLHRKTRSRLQRLRLSGELKR